MEALKQFELDEYADHYPDELSGGMRQKLVFCAHIYVKSQLSLLDEPFGKLDAFTKWKYIVGF